MQSYIKFLLIPFFLSLLSFSSYAASSYGVTFKAYLSDGRTITSSGNTSSVVYVTGTSQTNFSLVKLDIRLSTPAVKHLLYRPYNQRYATLGSCTIEIGQTYCSFTMSGISVSSSTPFVAIGYLIEQTFVNQKIQSAVIGNSYLGFSIDTVKPILDKMTNSSNTLVTSTNAFSNDNTKIRFYLKPDNSPPFQYYSRSTESSTGQIVNSGWKNFSSVNSTSTNLVNFSALPYGSWNVKIKFKDNALNASNFYTVGTFIKIIPDSIVPVIRLQKNSQNVLLNTPGLLSDFVPVITDNLDPNPTMTVAKISGGPLNIPSTNLSLQGNNISGYSFANNSGLAAGSNYEIYLVGRDKSGNTLAKSFIVTVDQLPPSIDAKYLNSPIVSGDVISNINDITINVNDDTDVRPSTLATMTDSLGQPSTLALTWNSTLKLYTINPINLIDGSYILTVDTTDASGKSSTKTVTFVYDSTGPEISVQYNGNDFQSNDSIMSINDLDIIVTDLASPSVTLTSVSFTNYLGNRYTPAQFSSTNASQNPSIYKLDPIPSLVSSLQQDIFTFIFESTDSSGNTTIKTINFYKDVLEPNVILDKGGEPFIEGDSVELLSELSYIVTDNIDSSPLLTEVHLTGGPDNVDIQLAWNKTNSAHALRSININPSLGYPYSLTAKSIDSAGNTTQHTATFDYSPRSINLNNSTEAKVFIPAVASTFLRRDGSSALYSEPLTYSDGSLVLSTVELTAFSKPDSEIAMVINGVVVNPGETVVIDPAYDLSANGSSFNLPAQPLNDGDVGLAFITIKTDVIGTPVFNTVIESWSPNVSLTSASWDVYQMLGDIEVDASIDSSTFCRLTSYEQYAIDNGDPYADPICLIVIDSKPETSFVIENPQIGLRGIAEELGANVINYSVYVYNGGQAILMSQGQKTLNVIPLSLEYTLDRVDEPVLQNIQNLNFGLIQIDGPICKITMNAETAKAQTGGGNKKPCFLEWTNIPLGLSQKQSTNQPTVVGSFELLGFHDLSWRVSAFKNDGTKIIVSESTKQMEVVIPNPPVIQITPAPTINVVNDKYLVSKNGQKLADVNITAPGGDLIITTLYAGEVQRVTTYQHRGGNSAITKTYVTAPSKDLWTEKTHTIRVEFSDMPEVFAEKTITSYAVPSLTIKMKMTPDSYQTTVLNTDLQRFTVKMSDFQEIYSASGMGTWNVHIGNLVTYEQIDRITPDKPMVDGQDLVFDVDLTGISRARLVAIATLVSPLAGYDRSIKSTQLSYTVLEGRALTGKVKSKRLSGQAPFNAFMQVVLDGNIFKELGKVEWLVSEDDGVTYKVATNTSRVPSRLYKTFELGKYKVKAIVHNKLTNAIFETPSVDVIAYNRPKFTIKGGVYTYDGEYVRIFPSDSSPSIISKFESQIDSIMSNIFYCKYDAYDCSKNGWFYRYYSYYFNYRQSSIDNVYEYSFNNGDTWLPLGYYGLILSPDDYLDQKELDFKIRARSKDAPADDIYAYHTVRSRIRIVSGRPIYSSIIGPRYIEVDKEYEYTSVRRDAYPGMLYPEKNTWTLPDNTIAINQPSVKYTPSLSDEREGFAKFIYEPDAYNNIDNVKGHSELKATVWQYIWPSFDMKVIKSFDYAPANVSFVLKQDPINLPLEDLNIEWVVPEGVTITQGWSPRSRTVSIENPGTYIITANISDARGNITSVTKTVTLSDMPPFDLTILEYGLSSKQAPYNATFRLRYSGGHRLDRILDVDYLLDGVIQQEGELPGVFVMNAGNHVVTAKIMSKMGITAQKNLDVVVVPNSKPTCTLSDYDYGNYMLVVPACTDSDGTIRGYEWYLDGELVSGANKYSVLKSDVGVKEIKMRAIDSSQDFSNFTFYP